MTTRESVNELVQMVLTGKMIEAFDKFYDDNVSMQENEAPPLVGKAANREKELGMASQIKEMHDGKALAILVDGDHAAIEWLTEFTGQDNKRRRVHQVARQEWQNGKIIREQFFYNPSSEGGG